MNKLKNPHILPRIFALIAIFLAFSLVADDAADAARRPQRPPPRGRAVKSAACVENAPGIAQLLANTQKKSANVDMRVQQVLINNAQNIAISPTTKGFNGGTVVITDGFRSCARNRGTRGSARNSAHLRGNAIDIRSNMGSPRDYANAIVSSGLHRPGGYYNTCVAHVHLDLEHEGFKNECAGKGKYGRKGKRRRRA